MAMLKARVFVKELILFSGAQALGLIVAFRYLSYFKNSGVVPDLNLQFSLTDIIFMSVFLLLFIFLAVRKNRVSQVFFRIFFWLVVFSGSQALFFAFVPPFWALIAAVLLVVLMVKVSRVWLQNLGVVLGVAGIGLVVGLSLTPLTAVFILAILSVYDIVAVYFTGHMVKMAEGMIRAQAIFGLVIPSENSGFKEKMADIKPGEQFMILGSGDVALPLILISSLTRISSVQAWFVAGFAVLGLLITHLLFVSQKQRRPMAALPPIAAMSIIGYLVTNFFMH